MKRVLKYGLITFLSILTVMFTSGCGGSSSGDSSSSSSGGSSGSSSTTSTASYSGTLSLSGSIDTSSLSSTDAALTRSRSVNSRAVSEFVKLYVLDANGVMQDTGITCNVSSGSYECPNIKGSEEYIVKYVKDVGNGKVLEMKTTATVGTTNPDPVKVDPITTMIVASVVEAVKSALKGVEIDQTAVTKIIASVKTAITTTMTTLVESGAIQIPSLVVEADFTELNTSNNATETTNSNLGDIASIVNTDDTVSQSVAAVKSETKGDYFSTLTNEQKMEAVFKSLGWDKGMPAWVLKMFSTEYANMDSSWTIGWFMGMGNFTAASATDITNDTWSFKGLTDLGYSATDINTFATTIATTLNTELSDGTVFNSLKTSLQEFYTIKAKTTKTDADIEFLANFDATIASLFPETFVNSMTVDTQLQNMGQLFLLMGYLQTSGESYIGSRVKALIKAKLDGDNKTYFDSQLKYVGERLFTSAAQSGGFLQSMYPSSQAGLNATLAKYDVVDLGYMSGSANNNWTGSQNITYLDLRASLSKLSWDMQIDSFDNSTAPTAVLTYPKVGGTTGQIDMRLNTNYGGVMFEVSYQNCTQSGCSYDNASLVEDFDSGNYTVTATYAGKTYTKTQELYFVKGGEKYIAKLISPKGQPQYPQELWGVQGNYTTEQQTLLNTFNAENQAYWEAGYPTFAPNTNSTASSGNDTIKGLVLKWEAPDVSGLNLPSNIQVAYSVDVRLRKEVDTNNDSVIDWQDCNGDTYQQCNTDIYNTWNDDKLITNTSITLPTALKVNTGNDRYQLSLNVMFVEKDTGYYIASGGNNWAEFKVGTVTELSGNETVTFNGALTLNTGATVPTAFKIALLGEVNQYSGGTWSNTRTQIGNGTFTSSNNTFSISATWDVLKDYVGNGKNIQIIGYNDANGDGTWQDWNSQSSEASYWMENSWINFEKRGDVELRVGKYDSTTGQSKDDSYRLKVNSNTTVDNLNIKIW